MLRKWSKRWHISLIEKSLISSVCLSNQTRNLDKLVQKRALAVNVDLMTANENRARRRVASASSTSKNNGA